jgi:single-strand DNA-binding protein
MLNEAHVSLTGYVATQPVIKEVLPGTTNLTMRVAWTPRRLDRATGEWVDGITSYVTVICWRKLASNIATCLRKGDPVIVKGRLSVRPYDDKEGQSRIAVEVEASSVGHDLSRGVAQFQRVRPQTGMTASEFAASLLASNQADGAAFGAVLPDGVGGLTGTNGLAGSTTGIAAAGRPDDDIFDESAIGELASDEDRAAVPF